MTPAAIIAGKEAELTAVVGRHDDMIRELFHMERFVTLITGFDPATAKRDRSQVFLDYKAPHDLVSRFAIQQNGSHGGRSARTTRRALATATDALALSAHQPEAGPGTSGSSEIKRKRRRVSEIVVAGEDEPRDEDEVDQEDGVGESDEARTDADTTPRKKRRPPRDPGPGEVLAYYIQPNGKKSHRKVVVKIEEIGEGYVLAEGRQSGTLTSHPPPSSERPASSRHGSKRKPLPDPPTLLPDPAPHPPKKQRKATPPPYVAPDLFSGVPVPVARYTHHEQGMLDSRRFGGALDQYLESYIMVEDKDADPKAVRDALANAVKVRGRINALGHQGRLLPFLQQDLAVAYDPAGDTEAIGTGAFRAPVEPKRPPGHRDHLLSHVLQVRNAILHEHKNGINLARRNAKSIQVFWEREKGRGEREQRDAERGNKAAGRALVKAIKARWRLAYKIVGARAQARAKAEQERLGQQHLSSILNRSLGLLADGDASPGAAASEADESTSGSSDGMDHESPAETRWNTTSHVAEDFEDEEPEVPEERDGALDDNDVFAGPSSMPEQTAEPPPLGAVARGSASSVSPELPADHAGSSPLRERASPDETDERDHALDVEMEAEAGALSVDSEDEGLLADADVPIEELLRKYGYTDDVTEAIAGLNKGPSCLDNAEPAVTPSESTGPRRSARARRVRTIRDADSPTLNERERESHTPDPQTSSDSSDSDAITDDEAVEGEHLHDSESDPDSISVPFLLRATLRPYQKAGLDWLARAYRDQTNVILADDMGLGKTIQTIALLGHLACDLGEWGPHLIVVPTSVILNWEMEFKKFLPSFRVMTYYGSQKERKDKRKGWYLEGAYQVCITSYQIVLADQHIFKMRKWHYMILDEAHNIKNFRSQRWQTLLGFKSQRRLLLTGTPLQNNLMELWSLLYFLMPHGLSDQLTEAGGFANHREFIEWFSNPLDKAVETGDIMTDEIRATVSKLHLILRPYMLRRLKTEVEKELPPKHEHVLHCMLSKRQRLLYDEFITRASTRESLQTGGYMGVANVLMKLRQVCNHPDLFEVRPIRTSFAMEQSTAYQHRGMLALVKRLLAEGRNAWEEADITTPAISLWHLAGTSSVAADSCARLDAAAALHAAGGRVLQSLNAVPYDCRTVAGWKATLANKALQAEGERWIGLTEVNRRRCSRRPLIGSEVVQAVKIGRDAPRTRQQRLAFDYTLRDIRNRDRRREIIWEDDSQRAMRDIIDVFAIATPAAIARDLPQVALPETLIQDNPQALDPGFDTLHATAVKLQIAFPDSSLLQYDCGKLQLLASMLRRLKAEGHRVLIFTVMTRMLDILEIFLNHSGHRYFRLDGSTKVEDRLILTERFNTNPKVFAFIASTRSGGVGINLTGADTVIFYDNDFNPAMDKQAMDRAHRIGQTREVNIYRMVTAHTVEENMLRKANQKRMLDELIIQDGDFTTDFFAKTDLRDYLPDEIVDIVPKPLLEAGENASSGDPEIELAFAQAEDEEDLADVQQAALDTDADAADFGDNGKRSDSAPRPANVHNGTRVSAIAAVIPDATMSVAADPGTPASLGGDRQVSEQAEDDYEEGEPGGVDEYMLRFAEWDWA